MNASSKSEAGGADTQTQSQLDYEQVYQFCGPLFAVCIKGGEYNIIHLVIICVLCWCILFTPIYLLEEACWPEIYLTMLSGTYLASSEVLHLCLSRNFIGVYISCWWILLCSNDAMKVKVILRAIIITDTYLGRNVSV